MNPSNLHSLGIIAGSHELPLTIAKEARRLGINRIIAIAFHNETSPNIESVVDEVEWIRVGQLSQLIKIFSKKKNNSLCNGWTNCTKKFV